MLTKLEDLYRRKGRSDEFGAELPIYRQLLPKLVHSLEQNYDIVEPVGLGSTASVWKVKDIGLKQPRALKLTRPSKSRSAEIIKVIREEPVRLASLNHQNIIKVFTYNEIKLTHRGSAYEFPYFVMEYLQKRADLDQAILNYRGGDWTQIVDYFKDALNGIDALHLQRIVHCDIKPGNILVPPNRPALVADLGYAKHLPRRRSENQTTRLITTQRYAHPDLLEFLKEASDPSAAVVKIGRGKLEPRFDLFAFGRTMQEILCKLRVAERQDQEREFGRESIFTPYQWQYLSIISKRLLDGVVDRAATDPLPPEYAESLPTPAAQEEVRHLFQDAIPELTPRIMQELKYQSAAQAIEDIEKLQHLYDLEGRVPELNPNARTYIQIPQCHVPLTDRVRRVINHPSFQRISQTTQLGFVSMVYPGARHTRYEHVLGTFWHCCEYIRALWYDQTNPLFQCVMTENDLSMVLLAALVHDLSQYPMAHDLTEIDDKFRHEDYLVSALETTYRGEASLADTIGHLWNLDVMQVTTIFNATDRSPFKQRLLKSVLDGVLDCDKLDYVRRDSHHAGVSFGLLIDHERLFRNLTTIWGSPTEHETRANEHHPGIAEIGVAEKAFVIAKSLMDARKDMFRQVYWQHTTRTLKAMLAFVVRRILITLRKQGREEQFWSDVARYVENPAIYYASETQAPGPTAKGKAEGTRVKTRMPKHLADGDISKRLVALLEDEADDYPLELSTLDPSDDSLLTFLSKYGGPAEKAMVSSIRARDLFDRVAVISHSRHLQAYEQLYEQFRQWRLARDFERIEEQRLQWENEIKRQTLNEVELNTNLLPRNTTIDELRETLSAVNPLVLVDVPIKATAKKKTPKYLRYVREDPFISHRYHHASYPQFESYEIETDETIFDKEVGKIRIVSHPEWRDLLIWVLESGSERLLWAR